MTELPCKFYSQGKAGYSSRCVLSKQTLILSKYLVNAFIIQQTSVTHKAKSELMLDRLLSWTFFLHHLTYPGVFLGAS